MLAKPEINLSNNRGDLNHILNLCETALIKKGETLNKEEEYMQAIFSMRRRVSESKSFESSLYILMDYCILK